MTGSWIDNGRIAGDDVGDQVAGPWPYAEAVTAEARRQNEATYARDLADPRNAVWRAVDIADHAAVIVQSLSSGMSFTARSYVSCTDLLGYSKIDNEDALIDFWIRKKIQRDLACLAVQKT